MLVVAGCSARASEPRPTPSPSASSPPLADLPAAPTPSVEPQPTASAPPSIPTAEPEVAASAAAQNEETDPLAACVPSSVPAGFERCEPFEATGSEPCELECERPRRNEKNECCKGPVNVVVFGKPGILLSLDTCSSVSQECFDREGKLPARQLHFTDESRKEIVVVAGGCELRALGHGYVPQGVAAWTGCEQIRRFRWNGRRFVRIK
jgi:hypothetical protein